MGIRQTPIINGEYYHFYNRGNSKQTIFIDDQDYDRFTKLLFLCNSKKPINFRSDIIEKRIDAWEFDREELLTSICAWVLMPNHFHLYIRAENIPDSMASTKDGRMKNGAIVFMQKLGTAYSKYFNTKYNRTGSLFEGKFKSVHVTNDNQARYLFSYIHLNPVKLIQSDWKERGIKDKGKAFEYAKSYKHSSLSDWLGFNRRESLITNKDSLKNILPENFSPSDDLFQWLSYHD
ncbi:MAG: hypothetical protein Q8R55_03010 [Candidatus Taylorbacteria bacterium]|nr:hypothetical protein [Candidatus Taylorbacteria bacterium]